MCRSSPAAGNCSHNYLLEYFELDKTKEQNINLKTIAADALSLVCFDSLYRM